MPGTRPNALHLLAAFLSGGLLTLMVHFNGELGRYGNALFSSWTAHATGTIAATVLLVLLYLLRQPAPMQLQKAPLWAYLGGISGAATVMLTSAAVNTPLALSGTLALALAGQVAFSLAADKWGLFGLPARRLELRDAAAIALIAGGSALIILYGKVAP